MVFCETPLIQSPLFDSPHKILLKLECCQPSGSFKSRGLSALVAKHFAENPKAHFYASSGGNAGIAVSEASFSFGAPSTIVVPESTPPKAIEKMRRWKSEVIPHGRMWLEADALLQTMCAQDPNGIYCHPFNDQVVWDGHGTLVDELKQQMSEKPGAVVLSVGGGGLFIGVMEAMVRNGWGDVPLYAVETEGASALAQSIEAGKRIIIEPPTSIAKTLGASWVPERAIELAQKYNVHSLLLSDEQALKGCKFYAHNHNVILEPACGVSVAAVLEDKVVPKDGGPIVVIVCGGSLFGANDIEAI